MMHRYVLLLFLLSFISITAQNQSFDSVMDSLEKNQLLFEKVFIHTNKTNYLNDDTIWFKAYVATRDNEPSIKTSLLHVNLFTKKGTLVQTQNILINSGCGLGQFEFNDTLESGKYYIQAFTNFMQNFGDENKFVSEITIGELSEDKFVSEKSRYDIQFFPEGGYLLEGVVNRVGIKALINGKGYEYEGEILDSKNKKAAHFKSEHLGMSNSKFFYDVNETYKGVFRINDTLITIDLPKANKGGLTIATSHENNNVLKVELQTNQYSIDEYGGKHTLFFHQKNKIVDYIDIELKDTSVVKLYFSKNDFYGGVNEITVFKENIPILERRFFIYKKNERLKTTIKKLKQSNDSITFNLRIDDYKDMANLSVSALSGDYNYFENTSIESAFLLTPFIKGYVEDPAYYFNNENENYKKHMDLLMLTQAWVKYSTNKYIETLNPELVFKFQEGYELKGKVNPAKSNNMVLLSNKNEILMKSYLNGKPEFNFKNLIAHKGDSVKVSFLKGIGSELIKPKYISFDTIADPQVSLAYNFFKSYKKKEVENNIPLNENEASFPSTFKNVTSLGIVNLNTKRRNKEYLDTKVFNKEHRKEVFDIGTYYKLEIPEKYAKEDYSLESYLLDKKGYRMAYNGCGDGFLSNRKFMGFPIPAILTIDGDGVQPFGDGLPLDLALTMSMNNIEDIAFRPPENQRAPDRIAIFTTEDYKKGITTAFETFVFKNGYDKSKKYYTPLHAPEVDLKYQEIDWKPNLITNKKGEVVFRIKADNSVNGVLFSVQGFTTSGKLISEKIVLN